MNGSSSGLAPVLEIYGHDMADHHCTDLWSGDDVVPDRSTDVRCSWGTCATSDGAPNYAGCLPLVPRDVSVGYGYELTPYTM